MAYNRSAVTIGGKRRSKPVEEKTKANLMAKVVGVDNLRIRRTPEANGEIIGHVKKDDILKVTGDKTATDFYPIVTAVGLEGYCLENYLLVYEDGEFKEI